MIHNTHKHTSKNTIECRFLVVFLAIFISTVCNQYILSEASFVDSSGLKPSIILILPQSFNAPTNTAIEPNENQPQNKLQQYVAVINNVQNERDDETLRQQYKKLVLQVRDAKSPVTGQLFYEHVFDYFPQSVKRQHLLIPLSLDQVSTHGKQTSSPQTYAGVLIGKDQSLNIDPQYVIVSIRPYQMNSGFGSESVEFVSSSPIPVFEVPTSDGRRSFAIVQTDKPIYKPDENVRIRAFIMNENFWAVTEDEFKFQIKNPAKIIVEEVRFPNSTLVSSSNGKSKQSDESLFVDYTFEFPPEPMLGFWTINLLHSDSMANDTISFEVKEYELPTFGIEFRSPKYILPSTEYITGSVIAKYHYGKPVQGKATFKFAYQETLSSPPKFLARSDVKTINTITGEVSYRISVNKFRENSPHSEIIGSRLLIEVTVSETATGHSETMQDNSCIFIRMPYRISFEDSIGDFKPGLSQQMTIQITEMKTGDPAPPGLKVSAEYTDQRGNLLGSTSSDVVNKNQTIDFRQIIDTEAYTDSWGRAIFNVGPIRDDISSIDILIKCYNQTSLLTQTRARADKSKKSDHLIQEIAVGRHTLLKHESRNGWISLMNKSISHLRVGDVFESDLLIRDAVVVPQRIFYMITARGYIINMDTLNNNGFVKFNVTEAMVPSIRVVLFALTHDSIGLLSDSIRIQIDHNFGCRLDLNYDSTDTSRQSRNLISPNDRGKLTIQARSGDVVSLIGVDSAVYSLNNRSRLSSSRVIERVKRLDTGCGFGGGKDNIDVFHNSGLRFFKEASSLTQESDGTGVGTLCKSIKNQLKQLEDIQLGYARHSLSSQPMRTRLSQNKKLISPEYELNTPRIRRKRDLPSEAERILKRYKDPLHKSCCHLGLLEDIPQQRNCSIRAKIVEKYMPDLPYCVSVYNDCCRYIYGPKELTVMGPKPPVEAIVKSRVIDEIYHAPTIGHLEEIESSTLVRNDFRETWLFDLVSVTDAGGKAVIDVQMPHSITTWFVSALALNKQQPMCIMPQPLQLTTFRDIFLQISMPYKVIQGEQIDLVATVFNYSPREQQVLVYMYGIEDVCSEAEPGERSDRKHIRVDVHSSQSVLFPLIPLRTGKFPIKVVAATFGNASDSDIIERQLNVVPKGRPVTDEITFSLDPMNHQRRNKRAIQTGNLVDEIDSAKGLQRSKVRLTPTRDYEFIVPQTQECIVSAIGDRMGQSVQTTMIDVENLIRLPHGCGEQVMIYLGPTLYTTRYLSAINKLTGDLRWRAVRYIQSGYKRILNYRRDDGSFSAFTRRDPSIWLTAFVVKMLCQTERTQFVGEEIHIDKTVISSALDWLIQKQDNETGNWIETNPVYHREMLGGVLRENALTAFVTLALNECSHHSLELVDEFELSNSANQQHIHTNGIDKLRVATKKAQQAMISSRHKAVNERNPYVLALTAYSLSFSHPQEAALVLHDMLPFADRSRSRHQLYWRGDYPIETAAYALQALMQLAPLISLTKLNAPEPIHPNKKISWNVDEDTVAIANWLTTRRSYTGAFESTQDTVVALEALSKLAQFQSNSLLADSSKLKNAPSLTCNVTFSNRTKRSIEFGKDNAQVLQTFKLGTYDFDPISGEMLDITTSGNGLGTMSIKLKYNVFQEEDDLCRFNVFSTIKEWKPDHITRTDMQDLHQEDKPNDTIEDHYFDKSMLEELNVNLVDANPKQQVISENKRSARRQMTSRKERNIRYRRYVSQVENLETSSTLESWTSKVVSSVKATLPSWFSSKTTTINPPPSQSALQQEQMTQRQELASIKKTSTSRRSTQGGPAQTIIYPNTVPSDANLNSLSNQFDIGQKNSTGNSSYHQNQVANRLILLLQVCSIHMARHDSEMAVIEVGILSGFKPNEADLREISNKSPATKYEISSDKSLVIIYLKYIPFSGQYCFQFRLVRDSLVYNIQSGYIRAYEYYSPTHSCTSFYTSARVTDLLETRCDSSGQVCQCAARSLCPATRKLIDLGEIQAVNATSARQQLIDLVCTNRYDLVSLVRLKSISYIEVAKTFELSIKIKSDLRGNLTKIIEAQKLQKGNLANSIRRPQKLASVDLMNPASEDGDDDIDTSMDYLSLRMDADCIRSEQLLRHLAQPESLKQGGEEMILFARSSRLERRYFKTAPKQSVNSFPRPKPNVYNGIGKIDAEMNERLNEAQIAAAAAAAASTSTPMFEDAQQLQYSMTLQLDKDSILHDMTFEAKKEPRETINNLILWLELRYRRERWSCESLNESGGASR